MKPDWDRLIKEFNPTAKVGLVADVDCTSSGRPLCDKAGVKGYPTIKWGDPNAMEDYKGGRDFDSLLAFAQESVDKPICSPANTEPCDDDQKAEIEKYTSMSTEELKAEVEKKEKEEEEANSTFEAEVKKLQETYEQLQKDKDATLAAIKDSGLGMMKAVLALGGGSDKSEL